MASFTGTLDKCKACDKTVYFVDLLSADGATYHKSCFKCSHCKGTLVMSNYSSMDGVLYCKTHFEQLFKESGNFSKNFQTGAGKGERENSLTRAPSKLSAMFSGTQDKCAACTKTVYPLEKMTMEGESYHKSCFKCAHGGCPLTHSSYAALDGVLYCKHHFQQLFMEKGNYQHVLDAASHKKTASMEAVDVDAVAPAAPPAEDQPVADEDEARPPPEEKKPADDDDDDSEKPPVKRRFCILSAGRPSNSGLLLVSTKLIAEQCNGGRIRGRPSFASSGRVSYTGLPCPRG